MLEHALGDASENRGAMEAFLDQAINEHGEMGRRAATFLITHMPEEDLQSLPADFLFEDLRLALNTRDTFPWGRQVPDDLFLDHVLPYAVLDERRDPWREHFLELARPLVAEAGSISEAVQLLNRNLFKTIGVHYSTERHRPNQSAQESLALGKASCTGLSILLVNACRAIGIPARIAGTPLWANKRGNHTWVEVWDGEWHFTGADEYTPEGLNHGWFTGDAAKARSDAWEHAIYASSWRRTATHFPMVWDLQNRSVPATDITHRYTTGEQSSDNEDESVVFLRVWGKKENRRLALPVELRSTNEVLVSTDRTRADPADLNDMISLRLKPGHTQRVRLFHNGERREQLISGDDSGPVTVDLVWEDLAQVPTAITATEDWLSLPLEERQIAIPSLFLSREESIRVQGMIWEHLRAEKGPGRSEEWNEGVLHAAGTSMRFTQRVFGAPPTGGRSLWISLHGGGGTTAEINDRQWQNQARLYEPAEGIYLAPRAPTNNWNLWHEPHIDLLLGRMIDSAIVHLDVDPNRIFLLGYSAGGDGVYQLAPRMADRWAAASMMAGHPNDASPNSLRNLPFAIFMGKEDTAYNRNDVAGEWGRKLQDLKQSDPNGYPHRVTLYEDLGHWMERRDAEALPWMAEATRDPWPSRVIWKQSRVLHHRFYWLALPPGTAAAGQLAEATVDGQQINLKTRDIPEIILRLSDHLLDLDQPVQVIHAGKVLFDGKVERSLAAIASSFQQRLDPASVATALLPLELKSQSLPDDLD